MTDKFETALDATIDDLATVLDLPIKAEWRSAVLDNLQTIAKAARLVMSFPLDDHAEAAPVYRA